MFARAPTREQLNNKIESLSWPKWWRYAIAVISVKLKMNVKNLFIYLFTNTATPQKEDC